MVGLVTAIFTSLIAPILLEMWKDRRNRRTEVPSLNATEPVPAVSTRQRSSNLPVIVLRVLSSALPGYLTWRYLHRVIQYMYFSGHAIPHGVALLVNESSPFVVAVIIWLI